MWRTTSKTRTELEHTSYGGFGTWTWFFTARQGSSVLKVNSAVVGLGVATRSCRRKAQRARLGCSLRRVHLQRRRRRASCAAREVEEAVHLAELLGGLDHARCAPAQCHLAVPPP